MPRDSGNFAPYAAAANVVDIIRRARDKSLPDPLTSEELVRMSVPEGMANRVLQALRFLGLIDEDGKRNELFERIRRASNDEYPKLLEEILRASYRSVFDIIDDPAAATDIQIENAFRCYDPTGQRGRMIMLFRGLCQEAGITEGDPPATRQGVPQTKERKRLRAPLKRKAEADQPPPPARDGGGAGKGNGMSFGGLFPPFQPSGPDYQLLESLLSLLPKDGKWTKDRRQRWLDAVTTNVDLLVEILPETTSGEVR